jgi:hypothetical protein
MLCPAQMLGTIETIQQSAGPFSHMARLLQVRLPGVAVLRPYNTTAGHAVPS